MIKELRSKDLLTKTAPMPKTRKDFEIEVLAAFRLGMAYGYGVDHENIHESEDEAILDFVRIQGFKTDAYKGFIYGDISEE